MEGQIQFLYFLDWAHRARQQGERREDQDRQHDARGSRQAISGAQ
jgi:hypothetical protein